MQGTDLYYNKFVFPFTKGGYLIPVTKFNVIEILYRLYHERGC